MGALPILIVVVATCVAFALRRTRHAELSLRVSQWTYAAVFLLSLLYFPMRSGFHVRPVQCEWTFDFQLAVHSLRNGAHIALFVVFFILTWAQLRSAQRPMAWSFAACFVMGFLVEIAEGATGIHHCRMRDLIPDMTGAIIGALLIAAARGAAARWRRRATA